MKRVCVFCGSSEGKKSSYAKVARELGQEIAKREWGLVYGGASIGVMGACANGALEKNGKVWGIIPQSIMDLEVGNEKIAHLEVVNSMHQRKERMYELSQAFVAMPGGMGTLDEFFEIFTWAQLEYHSKKIYLLNLNGFFDHLIAHIKRANDEGFVSDKHVSLVEVVENLESLLEKFDADL